MNRIQTAAVALLVAALPFAPTAFAYDRGYDDDRGHSEARHAGHGYGHDRHRWRHGHNYGYGHYERDNWGHRPQVAAPRVVLPLPPLPPVPVIVIKKHHDAHLVLRRAH